ncbi:MAG: hypothetical protein L0099_07370 [Acidobacteria bacterium]|nr:hypothetical protein [Acidobacteriota bacterium]
MIVETAIGWALRIHCEPTFDAWATRWLSGEDRSTTAAENAAMATTESSTSVTAAVAAEVASAAATATASKTSAAVSAAAASKAAVAAAAVAAMNAGPTKLQLLRLILRCCTVGDRIEVCTSRSRESVLEALETGVF